MLVREVSGHGLEAAGTDCQVADSGQSQNMRQVHLVISEEPLI